ncbi:MAG: hypothetical protein CSA55_05430 [Ilumatobacter coccineus]|uniref:Uncharacterized protein n=1 Tax=Ilumatobacter coccineus TaxID=467094 RepID=A0A2G6K7C6_9ACTN|nr:MAG: hypothetical protein CSA55_05430 [Ilumatobacter coccineus]
MLHYLNDYPGSTYGADKSAVANKMADNGAVLALLNGQDDGSNPVGEQVNGQPLYQNEIQNEGGAWYINQNYEHRDAAYEEILHFVHDNGIGVDGGGEFRGALPEFQTEIRNAQKNASANNLWGRGADNKAWLDELAKENSLSQEYLAAVIDTYYGLWGAWTGGDTGMWGMYVSKVRDEMAAGDPMGLAVAEGKFFQPYLTYNARIDPSFDGTFSLRFDSATPYTHHSRYLRDVTLVGSNNVGVIVNELNNSVTGNDGTNTVIFSGASSEYKVETANGVTTVTDTVDGRDGINTVTLVEKLQFTDATTDL